MGKGEFILRLKTTPDSSSGKGHLVAIELRDVEKLKINRRGYEKITVKRDFFTVRATIPSSLPLNHQKIHVKCVIILT